MATPRFTLPAPSDFSLGASSQFLMGFTAASGTVAQHSERLVLTFRRDETFEAVGVSLWQERGQVLGEVTGTRDVDAARRQVARILGLDVDASRWAELGERDPVVAKLQAQFPGFLPVSFPSPYEAAVWGIVVQRLGMRQAAKIRAAITLAHGDVVRVGSEAIPVFPSPMQVLKLNALPSLPAEKRVRLQQVAEAALDGRLDAERLRRMPVAEALEQLQTIRGVGPWTSQLVLMRGSGMADALPTAEPRVLRGVALAYGLRGTPSPEEYAQLADRWRPYRMWVSILLVRGLVASGQWSDGPKAARGARSPHLHLSATA